MKINCTGIAGKYDERNLTISKSGKHKYPSKKMFVEFLKKYPDIEAHVDIWSIESTNGKVSIKLELEYEVKSI